MYEEIKTAALYVRYSSANQTEQSIEGQTRVCRDFCKNHNIRIVETYADRATSASKDIEKRVEFLRMISDAAKHNFDAVVVYKLDRFSRSRYDMATYKYKLKKAGVQLISATENISSDPEGIILESVLEGMAEFYSAELGQKINRGMRESAMKSQYIGGTPPLGYKIVNKRYEIDDTTAPIIREAFRLFLEDTTIAEICRIFNAKGYRTSLGKRFGRSSFAKIFRNEKYIGIYEHRDIRIENAIPPIIDKDTWEKTQMKLKDLKPAGTYKASQIYLLSGKLICGECGSTMTASKNSNRDGSCYSYYVCRGKKTARTDCHMKNLRKDWIEQIILQDALSMLTDENIEIIAEKAVQLNQHELETTTDIPAYKTRLQEINTSLENLMKAIETGNSPEILVKRISDLEHEKRVLEAELKQQSREVIDIDKPHIIHWLTSLRAGDIQDPAYQKTLIDLFISKIIVTPIPTDSPESTTSNPNTPDFNLTITYTLSQFKPKTVASKPPTSRLEVKSDCFIHVITVPYWHRNFKLPVTRQTL